MRQMREAGRDVATPSRPSAIDVAGGVPPRPILWSATFMALIAVIPGCADRPSPEGRLVPYLDANGRLSYYYEDEFPESSPVPAPVAAGPPPNVAPGGRGDDQAYREMIAYRERQQQQIAQGLQERQYQQQQQAIQDAARRVQQERGRLDRRAQLERDNDQFLQRRAQADREAAARTQQMIDDQTRWSRLQSLQQR